MSFLYFLFWKEGLGSDLETLRNENEERATPICTSFQFQPFNWTRTGSCTTLKNRLNIRIVHPSQFNVYRSMYRFWQAWYPFLELSMNRDFESQSSKFKFKKVPNISQGSTENSSVRNLRIDSIEFMADRLTNVLDECSQLLMRIICRNIGLI